MTKTLTLMAVLLAASCGGGDKQSDQPTTPGHSSAGGDPCGGDPCGGDPCGGDPCGAAAAGGDFSDWQSFTKVSTARFFSKSHSKKYVEVYADDAAVSAFRAKQGPYAVGARIVKAQYAAESGGSVVNLTVMKKMPAGYDPENGDWYYGVYDPSGTKAMKEGKIDMCINCHDQVSEQDYVFAKTE